MLSNQLALRSNQKEAGEGPEAETRPGSGSVIPVFLQAGFSRGGGHLAFPSPVLRGCEHPHPDKVLIQLSKMGRAEGTRQPHRALWGVPLNSQSPTGLSRVYH